jgi:hypothetical protein
MLHTQKKTLLLVPWKGLKMLAKQHGFLDNKTNLIPDSTIFRIIELKKNYY